MCPSPKKICWAALTIGEVIEYCKIDDVDSPHEKSDTNDAAEDDSCVSW